MIAAVRVPTIADHRREVAMILRSKLRDAHTDTTLSDDTKTRIATKLWEWIINLDPRN